MDNSTVEIVTLISGGLSALALIGTVFVTWRVANTQKLLTQRQLLIPLWEYMSKLNDIDPNPSVVKGKQVQETVNTLELVALCCEGGMVDESVIKRTFREPFILLYDVVAALPEMPDLRKSGRQLLNENPSAMTFHGKLMKEKQNAGKLAKVK